MKYNYRFQVLRRLSLMLLLAAVGVTGLKAQLSTNKTYVVNGQADLVAPVDTFFNLTGSATGPQYGAMSYLNQYGMNTVQTSTGPVIFLLSTGYNPVEPTMINIGSAVGNGGWPNMYWNANSPVIIKPALGQNFNITTSTVIGANQSLVRFNAAWFASIDGEGIPGQRNLTFSMPATATQTTSRIVDILPTSGQRIQSVSIKNCNLIGNSNASAPNTFAGVYFGGVTSGTPTALGQNLNIDVSNNYIIAVQNGIYFRGLANAVNLQNKNITINNNIIGDYTNSLFPANTAFIGGANACGIYLNAVANTVVNNNIIRNTVATSANFKGIFLTNEGGSVGFSLDSNVQVTANRIYNLNCTSSGGLTGIRMNLGTHGHPLRILMANNMISKLSATNAQSLLTGFAYPVGILVEDVGSNIGLEVFFNSVFLSGSTLPAGSFSACFATGGGITGGITMMNNSYANTMGRPVASNLTGYTIYNVLTTSTVSPFRYSSFNNYFNSTRDGGTSFIARFRNVDYTSLKGYQMVNRTDTTSYSTIPPFKNDSDLTVNNGVSHRTFNSGANLTMFYSFYQSLFDSIRFKVNVDINGNTRSGMGRFTSIGCHVWSGDSTNNNIALFGNKIFPINGTTSWPTISNNNGSFATLTDAIEYLNHYGTEGSGDVVLEFRPGYPGESSYLPMMIDYPGSNLGRPVIVRSQTGFTANITQPNNNAMNNQALVRFTGANWLYFDGRTNRNIVMQMPALATNTNTRIVGITPYDTVSNYIGIRNCVLIGNSNPTAPNTGMGVYLGNPNTSGTPLVALKPANSYITISNNLIHAVRSGIVMFAPGLSINNVIRNNIVGGTIAPGGAANTTYIGGVANQAGIWVKGMVDIFIDSNVVRNCVNTGASSNGFFGIYVDESGASAFSGVNLTRNFVYNLETVSGTFTAGIRVNLGTATTGRGILIFNNFVGRILGAGTGLTFSNLNPAGISIDASAAQTSAGIALAHNTVHLSGNGLSTSGSGSAALFLGSNIQGGVESNNNIFGNRINRIGATGNRYAVLIGHTTTPFNSAAVLPFPSNNNNYFASGNGSNFIGANTNGSVNRANIINWRAFTAATPALAGMDGSSFNWVNTFKTDTTPDIELLYGGPVPGGASIVTGICNDIYGNARYQCPGGSTTVTRWVGAAEVGMPYPSLQGNVTYPINGIDDPPTPIRPNSGSFKTVRQAVNYLNSQGVDDPNFGGFRTIRMEIQSGYIGETDTFTMPITVLDFPRQAATRPVVLAVASGRSDTIRIVSNVNAAIAPNQSLLRFSGCKYFTIDGNNGSGGRGLTLRLPAVFNQSTNKVVDIISGLAPTMSNDGFTQFNGVKNCNIIGISTTTSIQTFAGVYEGGLTTPSNSTIGQNNGTIIENNFIGAVQYGVYMRSNGVTADMDNGLQVSRNIIGGTIAPAGASNTDYFGGVASAAGIWIQSQVGFNISGNTIRNSLNTAGAPRGIELATTPTTATVLSSVGKIDGNTIRNISTIVAGGAYGIFLNFGNDNNNVNRDLTISNNMISGIAAPGAAVSTGFANNPFGIFFNASANIGTSNTYVGVSLYYNSINLGQGTTMTVANAMSACLGIPSFIKSGVISMNNIYQNRLSGSGIQTYVAGVAIGGTSSPFFLSDYNDYFTNAASPAVLGNLMGNASSTTPVAYNPWFDIMKFTLQDTLSITSQAPFTNDNDLFIPGSTSSNLYQAGKPIGGLSSDISGNTRNIFQPSIGAHEYTGTYLDNIAPRIFNMTDATACQSGNILLDFNIYDKLLVGDSLYYRINGGAEQNTQAIISAGSFRRYVIPAQTSGTLIEYRLTAIDYPTPPNTGVYPAGKLWDTLSTGITLFPYVNGFEGVNNPVWSTQTITGAAQWELGVLGSNLNPPLGARSGVRSVIFRSSVMPVGASARLVSPCLDFSNLTSPTIRFYISQNSDLPAKRDSIQVKVSFGGNIWSNALRSVERVNNDFPLPGYRVVEVCLAAYRTSGLRIAIEGYSAGAGQNIQIDDIEIFDDVQTQRFTPSIFNQCLRDSIRLNLNNSDARFNFRAVDMRSTQTLGMKDGDGSNTWLGFLSPLVDTLKVYVEATNLISSAINTGFGGGFITCRNVMPDTVTVYVNRFYNGPFITAGLPFNGSYNAGDGNNPDGSKVGDTITYRFVPPAFYQNSDYGTYWSIQPVTAFRQASGIPFTDFTFTPPSGLNPGFIRLYSPGYMADSNIVFNFKVRINASSCDTAFSRVLRVVAAAPVANFTYTPAPTNLCANNNINFSAVSSTKPANNFPFTYTWLFGDGTMAFVENPTKVYANPGNYTVRFILTDRYGLSSEKSENITVLPSPVVNVTTNVPCALDSTIFTPNTQPTGTTYLWTFPNFSTQTREVAKYWFAKYDTAYEVNVKVTNASGCFVTVKKNIYVFAKPVANFNTTPHCLSSNVPISNSSTIPVGVMGYTWNWGNGQTSLSATPTYKYPASGTFTATLKVSSAFGCTDSLTKTVTVYDRPFAGFTVSNPCFGENDVTAFTNTTGFGGGLANVNYNWSFGDTRTSSDVNPTNSYRGTGVYTVSMLAVDKLNGCRDSVTRNITVSYKPVAQFVTNPDEGICVNNELKVFNNSYTIDNIGQKCDWTWGDGNTDTLCNVNHLYANHGFYTIRLITRTAAGCADTATKNITVQNPPILLISYANLDTTIYVNGKNKKRFTANIADAESWSWFMGDAGGSTRSGNNVDFVFSTKGTYWVKCIVKDLNGCTVTDSIQVVIPASVGVQEDLAAEFDLRAYPNPFSKETQVGFELTKPADVKITVLDLLGRTIRTYDMGKLSAGKHQQMLDEFGTSGTYLVRTEIDGVMIYKQVIKE